ncbi:MAG: carbon-nitrogen hydrolase family protein [Deltaproteobacteria bacterium]|nr:carbon-nitrogen hydrolase family protein [Deltaproteobacteria bacterium]
MWVAAVQLNSGPDIEANLSRARDLIAEAAGRGVQLVALPEHFAGYGLDSAVAAAAQPLDGPRVTEFRELAGKLGIFLLLGSFPEQAGPGERHYNTSVLISPQGQILAHYRKLHLFDVELPGVPAYRESDFTQPGREVVTASLPGTPWVAGLSVCYDLRFPELFREQVRRGANLLFLPAAFTLNTGRDHWETLLKARAIENLSYVVAPAQWGAHVNDRRTYGRSLIIDPWGLTLAQAADGEGIIYAWLDFERLDRLRRELPCLEHRCLK